MIVDLLSSQPEIIHDTTKSHPIFDNISLTRRIIDLLLINSKIGQSRLLSLALTCKAFSDPVLDILWESMNSLMPLLKLLSPFMLIDGFYVFRGPFDDQNLRRFDVYSRRVKKLTVSRDCSNVAPSTFIRLAQLRPLLLPALEELNSPSTSEQEANILLFLSSSLKRLNVGGDEAVLQKHIIPALSMIAYESGEQENPALTHLTLRGKSPSLAPGLLGQFFNLRHLSISNDIDSHNLREVGKLPNLESADIKLPDSLSVKDQELAFTKLRSLSITSSFSSLLLVLGKTATPNLESIVVFAKLIAQKVRSSEGPSRPEAPNNWRELVRVINSRWSSTLQSMTLIQNNPSTKVVINRTPPNLFFDLSPFQHLERLKIQNCRFFPCDEGVHFLALACPNLTVLHLPLECLAADPSSEAEVTLKSGRSKRSTTIIALWSLCDLCARLEDLQISLNVAMLPPFSNANIRTHCLKRLSVSSYADERVRYNHWLKVALHIDRLFPHLVTTSFHDGRGKDNWNEVKDILVAYEMVRLDYRMRRLPLKVSTCM